MARRTRAVSAFFSARPAALRTNTGLASLASSEASVCMYPGYVHESSERGNRDEGWGWGCSPFRTHIVLPGSLLQFLCGIFTRSLV